MQKYVSLGVLAFMGLLSMYFYYIFYSIHGEKKDFLLIYIFIIGIFYGIIKLISSLSESRTIHINFLKLFGFFLLQLLIVCICFFAFNGGDLGYGLVLFFKISFFLSLVTFLWTSLYCLGDTLGKKIDFGGIKNRKIQILASLGVGFTLFMLGVFLLLSASLYTANSILLLVGFISVLVYKSWIQMGKNIQAPLKSYNTDNNLHLVIDELHYIVITFLISVNLVSVYRPFPIGWDDLGAYMNYPKLLSGAGEHLALGKMYLWEIYTGIGFLFGSQTLAFYLNSFSGILVAIVIYLSISRLTEKKESSFDLGLFSAMIVLMMPMVVFQLSKDMKLDLGLLSISIIALSVLYEVFFSKNTKNILLYILIGALIGVAFSIKVTSLLLLLGAFSALFYKKYSLGGFVAFSSIFIGIFSYLNLWGMMNVVISVENQSLKLFAMCCLFFGGALFIVNHALVEKRDSEYLSRFCLQVGAIMLGVILILLPWGVKNISEIPEGKQISASNIIGGYSSFYKPDYSLIYSDQEIAEIREKKLGLSESGTTNNEDFGRYFGYEDGINNYLKLPWNLTFQTNQGGEFTDITYIFFALLPALFLFLPYRKEEYKYPVVGVMITALLYFIPGSISSSITQLFSNITLPMGYAIIGVFALAPLVYFHFTLDKNNKVSRIFLVNLAFSTIYIGLWAVSAFGIVWYGILMYFLFLIMINLSLLSAESEGGEKSKYVSYVVLAIVWVYLLQSAIPHGLTNLKNTGYSDYKLGGMSEEGALLRFHPEYFSILFELNISEQGRKSMFIEYRNRLLDILDDSEETADMLPKIQSIQNMSHLHQVLTQLSRIDLGEISINELKEDLYNDIIYPDENKNLQKIHRVGTFLKYYISENNTRLLEDSLLNNFDNYIYNTDAQVSVKRFENLDVGYVLLDLNAATIDKDKRKNLTQRYENMLKFLAESNSKLVETDSVCLRVALDNYALDSDIEKYMNIAGVNYSYKISAQLKKEFCADAIMEIISDENKIQRFPYLGNIASSLKKAKINLEDKNTVKNTLMNSLPNGYKALFKIQ